MAPSGQKVSEPLGREAQRRPVFRLEDQAIAARGHDGHRDALTTIEEHQVLDAALAFITEEVAATAPALRLEREA